ncbi:MAG: adenylyl-sulfate kinase [Pirellula sp.]|jgi:adenylylsulfate kinase
MSDDPQVIWHQHSVSLEQRATRNGHKGCVLWFTGLSGSGKSTIANLVDQMLFAKGLQTFVLDGDNVRHGLCAGPNLLEPKHGSEFASRFGLGFNADDREENIRRVGCLAELFASAGLICLSAFVSPYRKDRELVRHWLESKQGPGSFLEVYVNTPIDVCMQRDPKGLYKQALEGKIKNFTGISDPYEPPIAPDLMVDTSSETIQQSADRVIRMLQSKHVFQSVE